MALQKLDNSISSSKLRNIQERMLVLMAFADVYGKEDQFLKKDLETFKYQSGWDFTHGSKKVCIVPGRVNDKLELTGTRVRFSISAKTVRNSPAEWFVMAAIQMPHIKFVGWLTQEDMLHFVKGWSCNIYAGCPRLQSMNSTPLENKRRKGHFV